MGGDMTEIEYLDRDSPLPAYDYSLPPMPCFRCGAVRVGGVRATYKLKVARGYTWFKCRVCGECFQLPRRELTHQQLLV